MSDMYLWNGEDVLGQKWESIKIAPPNGKCHYFTLTQPWKLACSPGLRADCTKVRGGEWYPENCGSRKILARSRQRLYRVSEAHFLLVWFRNRLNLGLGFSNKGLSESRILKFATPYIDSFHTCQGLIYQPDLCSSLTLWGMGRHPRTYSFSPCRAMWQLPCHLSLSQNGNQALSHQVAPRDSKQPPQSCLTKILTGQSSTLMAVVPRTVVTELGQELECTGVRNTLSKSEPEVAQVHSPSSSQ